MKKNWGFAAIILFFMAMLAVGMVGEYIHLSAAVQVMLLAAMGMLFGFILSVIHGHTRSLSGVMVYVVVLNAAYQIGNGLFSGWTLFCLVEIGTLFAAPVLGWFVWNKAGCPSRKEMDIDA